MDDIYFFSYSCLNLLKSLIIFWAEKSGFSRRIQWQSIINYTNFLLKKYFTQKRVIDDISIILDEEDVEYSEKEYSISEGEEEMEIRE